MYDRNVFCTYFETIPRVHDIEKDVFLLYDRYYEGNAMNTEEQLRLVKKAIKGDPDAYGQLIAEHQEYLYKMAYLYVRNEDAALDVVGTVMLNAYQGIRSLKEPQ